MTTRLVSIRRPILYEKQQKYRLVVDNLFRFTHSTRSQDSFVTQFLRVDAIRIDYRYQFVHIRNGVPEIMKNVESMKLFKKKIIFHFLDQY